MFAFSWYEVRGRYQINHYSIVDAGRAVDRLTPKDAVVLALTMATLLFSIRPTGEDFHLFIFQSKIL